MAKPVLGIVLALVACKSDKLEKLDPPSDEIEIKVTPPPPPPPPPIPPRREWRAIETLDNPDLQRKLSALVDRFPPRGLAVCFAIDGAGHIVEIRIEDAEGYRVMDAELDKLADDIRRGDPLPLRPEDAATVPASWSCNRDPGPAAPQKVAPTVLEGQRLSGTKQIAPDDETRSEIAKRKQDKVIGTWKLCIDKTGSVVGIKALKRTGFAAYDKKIETEIAAWKYEPYVISKDPVPVCSAVTFKYSLR